MVEPSSFFGLTQRSQMCRQIITVLCAMGTCMLFLNKGKAYLGAEGSLPQVKCYIKNTIAPSLVILTMLPLY